jgi:hypothetical protein
VLLLVRVVESRARWEERLRLADERARVALDSAARRAARVDSLRAVLHREAHAAREVHRRAREAARALASRAESLAVLRDSLLRALPPASAERRVIAAEVEARRACERRAESCEALVTAIGRELEAADSVARIRGQETRLWREVAERNAEALRRARGRWAIGLYGGFGISAAQNAAGWQIGVGVTRVLIRLPW